MRDDLKISVIIPTYGRNKLCSDLILSLSKQTKKPFEELILADEEIHEFLTEEELRDIFSYERYYKNVDFIFNRIGI